jgi:hypothetical protein
MSKKQSLKRLQKVSSLRIGFDVLIELYVTVTCLTVYRNAFYTHDVIGKTGGFYYRSLKYVKILSHLSSHIVACWPLVPKFAGSNPAEAVGFF